MQAKSRFSAGGRGAASGYLVFRRPVAAVLLAAAGFLRVPVVVEAPVVPVLAPAGLAPAGSATVAAVLAVGVASAVLLVLLGSLLLPTGRGGPVLVW